MKAFIIFISFLTYANFCFSQNITEDQFKHFGAGVVISNGTYATIYSLTKNKKKAFWYSMGASIIAGFAKELRDSEKFHTPLDTNEALATSFGGLTVTFNLFEKKKKNKHVALNN
ncbi:hypothetical protein [Neotamlana laminarinivorans]|uniref:Uncharacterized protein n=1 Tax=Neotamlana laminarinivorans TaxID=2883124 RepID=A0A9X1I2W6_9FLAO|nr:hypothetical protein [Tamlana laminarinivorans]MCB4800060.1 hypothetical protein [Tamlana laminarinivorans]